MRSLVRTCFATVPALLLISTAQAAVVTYNFTATVTTGTTAFPNGTQLIGDYTFDDAVAPTGVTPTTANYPQPTGTVRIFTVNLSNGFTGNAGQNIFVANDQNVFLPTFFQDQFNYATTGGISFGAPTISSAVVNYATSGIAPAAPPVAPLTSTALTAVPHTIAAWGAPNMQVQFTHFGPNPFLPPNQTVTATLTSLQVGRLAIGGEPPFQVRYASNLTNADSVINIINTGFQGAPLNGPNFGGAAGNICVNVYTFSPDEQLIACCSCLVTPNGLVSLSVVNDLITNTLTGVRPNSVVVKLVATATGGTTTAPTFTATNCTNSAASGTLPIASGMRAFGTTIHAAPAANTFETTETAFLGAILSDAERASLVNRCTNIIGNGSTFGICRSCRQGGLGAARQ